MLKIIAFFLIVFNSFFGNAIAIEKQRVVSLAPAITEIVFALGKDAYLVGVTDYCDYPESAKEIKSIGGFINPNLEKIISLNPTLVILSPNSGTKVLQKKLDRLKIKNEVVSFYSIINLKNSVLKIGQLLNSENKAIFINEKLDYLIHDIQRTVGNNKKPKVLFIRNHRPLYVAANATFEDELVVAAGGVNVIKQSKMRYPQYSLEEIIRLNPDVIIDATYYDTPSNSQILELKDFWKPLREVSAIRNNNLYVINTDVHSVPGPRTVRLIKILSKIIHPDLFSLDDNCFEQIQIDIL